MTLSDKVAAATALIALIALFTSIYFSYSTYILQRTQNSVNILVGSSDENVTEAGFTLIEAATNPPQNRSDLIEFRRRVSPMRRQLQAVAACLYMAGCDQTLVAAIFCERASDYERIVQLAHRSAGEPRATEEKFYSDVRAECR